jgi:hypothetical protein
MIGFLHLPDSFFYNDDHLNQAGVNVFNKKLMDILQVDTLKYRLIMYPAGSTYYKEIHSPNEIHDSSAGIYFHRISSA